MHIGLIIYGSIETLTGGYLYDNYLVRHLEERGHRVDIISLSWRNYYRYLGDNFSKKLLNRLLQSPFDLLLQDELNHPSLFLLNRTLRRKARFPIVTIVHQVLCRQPRPKWQNAFYRAIETRFLSSVDACIFNSRTTSITVKRLMTYDRPSLVACPGGDRLGCLRSEETIRTRAHEKGPLRLLFIANVLPHKGLYELIAALSSISPEKWYLTVVGSLSMDRDYVRSVEGLIRQKHLSRAEASQESSQQTSMERGQMSSLENSQQILLTGPLVDDELAAHLLRSHILVLPFSVEGFGIAYLEGMAYGLPAIGSSKGAVKDFIRHEHNGFLVTPNNQKVFIQHIESLYNDRERLTNMGIAALETFHTQPTWAESMESVHSFLKKLANENGAHSNENLLRTPKNPCPGTVTVSFHL